MTSDRDDEAVTPQQIADALEDLSDARDEARGDLLLWLGKHGDRSVLGALERAALHEGDSWLVEGAFVDHDDFVSDYACTAVRSLLERVTPTDEDRARWARILAQGGRDEGEEARIRSFFEDGLGQHAYDIVKDASRDALPSLQKRAGVILKKLEWRRG